MYKKLTVSILMVSTLFGASVEFESGNATEIVKSKSYQGYERVTTVKKAVKKNVNNIKYLKDDMSKLQANQDYLNKKIEKLEKMLDRRNVYVVIAKKYINVRIKPNMKSPTVGKIPHGMEIFAYCKKKQQVVYDE